MFKEIRVPNMIDHTRVLVKRFLGLYDNDFSYIKEIHKISDENGIQSISEIEDIMYQLIQDENIGFEFENQFFKLRGELMRYLLDASGIDYAYNSDEWDAIESQELKEY
ncbi:MAG: hypothetical protein ACFFAS_09900 [Promethearchaeota archaeon]